MASRADTGSPKPWITAAARRLVSDTGPCLIRAPVSYVHLGRDRRVVVLVDRREEAGEARVAAERAAAALEMLVELLAELRHAARHWHRCRVAEHAQALADDPVADVEQHLEVRLRRRALLDGAQDLDEPASPHAARRALAARLVHVELCDTERELHDARAVVDRADDAGADEEADLSERVRVELRVELVRRHHRKR